MPAAWGRNGDQGSGASESGAVGTLTLLTARGWQVVILKPPVSSYWLLSDGTLSHPCQEVESSPLSGTRA